jgi:hypothetical protein
MNHGGHEELEGHDRKTVKRIFVSFAIFVFFVVSSVISSPAAAQWIDYPSPGIPRLADGTPNLAAPVPRAADGHPDLSGIWTVGHLDYFQDLAKGLAPGDVEFTAWGAAVLKMRLDRDHRDDPYGQCLPLGVPRIDMRSPFKIVQTPLLTAMLHETFIGMIFRQVFTDGRPLPKAEDAEPTWLGYSVGRWDGDTLVVDTTGFRDNGWLSAQKAYPHSDALHVTERFRRRNFGEMELTVTIDDPKTYRKPWTNTIPLRLQPDTELLEAFCDNQLAIMRHWMADPAPQEPPSPREVPK